MEATTNYLTDEILAFIGVQSEPVKAWDRVEASALRRFAQAIMDDDPAYWDEENQRPSKGVVAPPLYPLHAFRRAPSTADPLEDAGRNPDFDGAGQGLAARLGLPPLPLPFKRMLNGGNDVEIYALARPDDRLVATSRYLQIFQKEGRTGPMIFVVIETEYATDMGELLLVSRQTQIWR